MRWRYAARMRNRATGSTVDWPYSLGERRLSCNRRSEDPGAGHSGSMRLEIQTKNNTTETETISVPKRNPKKKQRPHWRLPKWPQSNDQTKGIQKAAAVSPNAKPIPTIILAIRSRIILPRYCLSSITRVTAGAFGSITLICRARRIGRGMSTSGILCSRS